MYGFGTNVQFENKVCVPDGEHGRLEELELASEGDEVVLHDVEEAISIRISAQQSRLFI
jgi:hypothetical protein